RQLVTPSGSKIAHRPRDLAEYAGVPEGDAARLLNLFAGESRIVRPLPNGSYEIYHDALAGPILAWRQRHEAARRGRLELRRRAAFLGVCAAVGGLVVGAYVGGS